MPGPSRRSGNGRAGRDGSGAGVDVTARVTGPDIPWDGRAVGLHSRVRPGFVMAAVDSCHDVPGDDQGPEHASTGVRAEIKCYCPPAHSPSHVVNPVPTLHHRLTHSPPDPGPTVQYTLRTYQQRGCPVCPVHPTIRASTHPRTSPQDTTAPRSAALKRRAPIKARRSGWSGT